MQIGLIYFRMRMVPCSVNYPECTRISSMASFTLFPPLKILTGPKADALADMIL